MKIKLIENLPVENKHGMTKGRVFDVIRTERGGSWVMGDAGEEVKVWMHECEVIE